MRRVLFELLAAVGVALLISAALRGRTCGSGFTLLEPERPVSLVMILPPRGAIVEVSAKGGTVDVTVLRGSVAVAEYRNVTLAVLRLDVWRREPYTVTVSPVAGEVAEVKVIVELYGVEKDLVLAGALMAALGALASLISGRSRP